MINRSKKKDPRFWKRWEQSGATGKIASRKRLKLIRDAKSSLTYVRSGINDSSDIFIDRFERLVAEARVTLAFIGTSEEEIKKLRYATNVCNAKSWLTAVRRPSSNSSAWVIYVRKYSQAAGVTLEFLGTNEEELDRLIIAGHLESAREWLRLIRNSSTSSDCAQYVTKYARMAGVTLEFLGTSEEELKQLAKLVHA
jgi:hypothetical protein